MSKETENKECCSGHHHGGLTAGFRFGFGFWCAGLLVWTIATMVAVLIWFVSTLV